MHVQNITAALQPWLHMSVSIFISTSSHSGKGLLSSWTNGRAPLLLWIRIPGGHQAAIPSVEGPQQRALLPLHQAQGLSELHPRLLSGLHTQQHHSQHYDSEMDRLRDPCVFREQEARVFRLQDRGHLEVR